MRWTRDGAQAMLDVRREYLNGSWVPIPATKEHPRRADDEYERAGTASLFMFCEPLAGWRQVRAGEHRTKVDWAIEMAALLNGRYATAGAVILVCDNLNTHTIGAFYEAFDAETARARVRRLEFRHTPDMAAGSTSRRTS
ncbi:hypothetical protein R5W24_005827 [Gemmata sp. JC717]|uniref:Tc1-like transposase DDE domain-containing protein n=1 Tax=Gemmata algarum TaxID=2975278 RepID=A0ABU5F7M8_9BACT|nr:hypothetical protein [Gemmata algarum]MDY3556657.1 hypothetical protein [Gemmata algarum]MDY3563542.1 hypothetical protein [Gemmata algarum]